MYTQSVVNSIKCAFHMKWYKTKQHNQLCRRSTRVSPVVRQLVRHLIHNKETSKPRIPVFVRILRFLDSPHKASMTRKVFLCHEAIMYFTTCAIYSQVPGKTTCEQVTTEVPGCQTLLVGGYAKNEDKFRNHPPWVTLRKPGTCNMATESRDTFFCIIWQGSHPFKTYWSLSLDMLQLNWRPYLLVSTLMWSNHQNHVCHEL